MEYRVVEIFSSIEGEGSLIGYPMTFIRLEGCNLRCVWCDTTYSYDNKSFKILSLEEIITIVKEFKNIKVCITGGEPLITSNVHILIERLLEEEYSIVIETNGTFFSKDLEKLYSSYLDKIHTVVSPKPEANYFINKNLIPFLSEIKFVIDSTIELTDILRYRRLYEEKPLILQPESNKPDMVKKALDFQKDLLINFNIEARLIPQCHKLLNLR